MATSDVLTLVAAVAAGLSALLLALPLLAWLRRRLFRARLAMALGTPQTRRRPPEVRRRLARLGQRLEPLLGARVAEALHAQVHHADDPLGLSAQHWLALRGLAGLLGLALALGLLARDQGLLAVIGALLVFGLGLGGIDLWLVSRAQARRRAVERGLPTLVDLLALCLGAGMSFETGLASICDHLPGPLALDVKRYLTAVNELGEARGDALRAMARHSRSREVHLFAAAVIEATETGSGLLATIESQAQLLRRERQRAAEASAKRAPVRMLFPLTLFILPVLMLVVLGPTALRLLETIQTSHH